MIKEYCIIYEVTEECYEPSEGVYTTTLNWNYLKTETKTVTIPAPNIVEAINYAINKLKVPYQDILIKTLRRFLSYELDYESKYCI